METRDSAPLSKALAALCAELTAEGHPEHAALLSEARVRAAIRAAAANYDALDGEHDAYWHDRIRPICLRVADHGEWPEGCSFTRIHTITERRGRKRIISKGLGVRLHVDTPGDQYEGFALPVVDVWFGRVKD